MAKIERKSKSKSKQKGKGILESKLESGPITPRTPIVRGNKINREYEGKEELMIA